MTFGQHKGEVHHCTHLKQGMEVQMIVPLLGAVNERHEAAEQDPE